MSRQKACLLTLALLVDLRVFYLYRENTTTFTKQVMQSHHSAAWGEGRLPPPGAPPILLPLLHAVSSISLLSLAISRLLYFSSFSVGGALSHLPVLCATYPSTTASPPDPVVHPSAL